MILLSIHALFACISKPNIRNVQYIFTFGRFKSTEACSTLQRTSIQVRFSFKDVEVFVELVGGAKEFVSEKRNFFCFVARRIAQKLGIKFVHCRVLNTLAGHYLHKHDMR